MNPTSSYHTAVLLNECIEQLNIVSDGYYLDATFGGGGHSREILKHLGPEGKLMVFDQDADAKQNLPDDDRIIFIPENFKYASRFVRLHEFKKLNGVLADLGVSSFQFDTADRGFSTRFDAQLDMRMDTRNPLTAEIILNTYSEKDLQMLFEQYGEVTNAKTLAKIVTQSRKNSKLSTINEFKQLISSCVYGNPNKYLAQVFQALRIEVNHELNALKLFLETITASLSPQGRLAIITFHSLEDRIVKQWMKQETFDQNELDWNLTKQKLLKLITKKPILPSDTELTKNPRSRSAKLRVAEKI